MDDYRDGDNVTGPPRLAEQHGGQDGQLTVDRILSEAMMMFAARSYAGVSIREICKAASVNASSLYHHFGSKQGLMRAICERLLGAMRTERASLLDAALGRATALGQPPEPTDVLTAFIRPMVRIARHPTLGATPKRLTGQLVMDTTPEVRAIVSAINDESSLAFVNALRLCYPDLTGDRLAIALQCTWGAMILVETGPHGIDPSSGVSRHDMDIDQVTDDVVRFVAAGIASLAGDRRPSG